MSAFPPVMIGCAGLGGYAGAVRAMIIAEERGPSPALRLAAVCEPNPEAHGEVIAELEGRGVRVFREFDELLAAPIEAVWLPLPIHLHRPFTERALAAGKAVMTEKPAAGSVQDVDAMIAARDRAGLPVAVGFQDIYRPETLAIKRRLLAGEIGEIRSVVVHACWPRNDRYFNRSPWAGKISVDGAWVLDSPAQNALSHFINLPLFFLGSSFRDGALPVEVEAELYRVNEIENYDTCSLRVTTAAGASFLALFTHASTENLHPEITVHGDKGTMRYRMAQSAEFTTAAGTETLPLVENSLACVGRRFANLVRGADDESPIASLEMAKNHVTIVNGVSEVAPIHNVTPVALMDAGGATLKAIEGISGLFAQCAQKQTMLHESGLADWTRPASRRDLRGYSHFAGPVNGFH